LQEMRAVPRLAAVLQGQRADVRRAERGRRQDAQQKVGQSASQEVARAWRRPGLLERREMLRAALVPLEPRAWQPPLEA